MKISIITTSYNSEKYIEETIESVLSQRGNFEVEYILIDAKSADTTLDIANRYKKLVDEGFYSGRNLGISMQVISEPDAGMYEGIAKGLKLATGDVVAWINSDDFYLPNAFSCVCKIFEKFSEINWLTGRENSFNENGQSWQSVLQPHFYQNFIKKGFYGTCLPVIQQESTFWRKKLLDKIDFEEFKNKKLAGDFYLWYNFSKENKLYIVNSNLGGFRFNDGQKSTDKDAYNREFRGIVNDYKPSFIEKIIISHIKKDRRLSDKRKMKKNTDIVKFDFGTRSWFLG